jgi:hypothetical protein
MNICYHFRINPTKLEIQGTSSGSPHHLHNNGSFLWAHRAGLVSRGDVSNPKNLLCVYHRISIKQSMVVSGDPSCSEIVDSSALYELYY